MKTTVREFLKEEIDIDVVDDIEDSLWIAFCGPMELTEEGEKYFADVLDLDVFPYWQGDRAVVRLEGHKDWKRLLRKVKELFESLAGYCSEDDWDRWFKEG